MLVFAFDRDWTVDVNPHPHHQAVPLTWVRHLAHETEHEVYAIGNQDLAEEAAIPGVVDIVGRHSDDWDEWLGDKQPDGYYEQFPLRRERLALIEDLHPDADGYVVVDDLDLSDVDGWDHYHAWEFVPAVEHGEIDPELPWTDQPVTDGGRPTKAGIMPADPSHLREFLAEHGDAPAFELTYTVDGAEQTQLLWDLSPAGRTFDRPAAKPAVKCTPTDPNEAPFTISADSVEMLNIVDPPIEQMLASVADSPAAQATILKRLASSDPDAVAVSDLLAVIETSGPEAESEALEALRAVANSKPGDCTAALPVLRSILAHENRDSRVTVLKTIRAIAEDSPADVAPLVSELEDHAASDHSPVRFEAVRCLESVADGDPVDVRSSVPILADVVADRKRGVGHALHAMACISREAPEALEPIRDTLADCLRDEELSDTRAMNAMAALGRTLQDDPTAGLEVLDAVVDSLDSETPQRRANAAALISEIAQVYTHELEPYLDELVPLLTDDDPYCRVNTSATISRIAEDFPDAIEPHSDIFIELLDDEHQLVRENACWALGHLEASDAQPALKQRLREDSEEDVRDRAAWALSEIDPIC